MRRDTGELQELDVTGDGVCALGVWMVLGKGGRCDQIMNGLCAMLKGTCQPGEAESLKNFKQTYNDENCNLKGVLYRIAQGDQLGAL